MTEYMYNTYSYIIYVRVFGYPHTHPVIWSVAATPHTQTHAYTHTHTYTHTCTW